MTIIYTSNPGNIQTAIDIAKRLEGGLSLVIQQQNVYSLEEKVAQLSEQILAMQGQPAKIPIYQPPQKRQQWQAKSEAKQGFICFNCQNEGHMAKDCNMLTRCGNCKRNGHT